MPKRKHDQDGLYRRGDSPYWWASFTDASGRRTRCSTGTQDRKEAEALLAKWRLEAHRARQWGEQPSRTFDELMLNYLRETAYEKRSTLRDRFSLKRLYPVFTGRELTSITAQDIRTYITLRREAKVTPSTINKEIGLLSAALNYARREWGWDVPNPAAGRRLRESEGRLRWLTRAEAAALIQAARQEHQAPYLADLIQLALHTGMRRGELLGLEWRRVDLQAGLIYLEAEHTKAGKRRGIPLNRAAHAAIMSRLRFKAQACPATPWVFCGREGHRVQSVKRSFTTACHRVGIEDFRFHDLRHTCAAWLVTAGVPLPEVRDLLGHSTVRMTEKYAHLAPENVRLAVTRLEDEASRLRHVEENKVSEKVDKALIYMVGDAGIEPATPAV